MQATAKLSIVLSAVRFEEYAGNIIDNIKNQTIKNWECIIVERRPENAETTGIGKLVSGNDCFSVLQIDSDEPADAYNAGLEAANGRYVAFCDPDVSYDRNYFERLYNAAFRNKADLAVGNLRYIRQSVEEIFPLDPVLTTAIGVKDKLFKRKLILNEGIRFRNDSCSPEMLFCLEFESKCGLMFGCRNAELKARELPVKEKDLPSIHTKREALIDAEAALKEGLEILRTWHDELKKNSAGTASAEKELATNYEKSKSSLCCSFAKEILIDGIYRHYWITDDSVLKNIGKQLLKNKDRVFPHDWTYMVRGESGDLLFNEEEIPDTEAIANAPNISFAVYGFNNKDELNNTIEGIYCQNSPQFEVIVDGSLIDMIDDKWKEKKNFFSVASKGTSFRNAAYRNCRGKYIWFIDRAAGISLSIAGDIYKYMERNMGVLFASVPLHVRKGLGTEPVKANSVAFLPEFSLQKKRTAYNQTDYFWVNKLISVTKLNAMEDPFKLGDYDTLERFYRYSRYSKNDQLHVTADITEDDVLKKVKSPAVKTSWKNKLRKEEKFRESTETRDVQKYTFRDRKKKIINDAFRFLSLKVAYPLIYILNSLRPVDPKKVIFVEPAKLEIDANLTVIVKKLEELGGYKIETMCLGRKFVRIREQFKREAHFIKEMATARYVFTAEALGIVGCFNKRKGTTLVELWHACGAFKQFGYSTADYVFGGDLKQKNAYPGYRNMDIITVSSPEVIWAYEEAMGYQGTDVVKATGVSRTDVFYDKEHLAGAKERIDKIAPEAAGKKIILYAPTFRGRIKYAKGPNKLDIRQMREALRDEYYLLIKHHPFVKVPPIIPDECKDFAKDVSGVASIEDLICVADICISDYSSLVFEYSLFERPMIFFAYDIEEYDEWRGFYYDYDELTPGPIVYTTEEIIEYIEDIENRFDIEEVVRFRDKFMSACDGHATERILECIGIDTKAGKKD